MTCIGTEVISDFRDILSSLFLLLFFTPFPPLNLSKAVSESIFDVYHYQALQNWLAVLHPIYGAFSSVEPCLPYKHLSVSFDTNTETFQCQKTFILIVSPDYAIIVSDIHNPTSVFANVIETKMRQGLNGTQTTRQDLPCTYTYKIR